MFVAFFFYQFVDQDPPEIVRSGVEKIVEPFLRSSPLSKLTTLICSTGRGTDKSPLALCGGR